MIDRVAAMLGFEGTVLPDVSIAAETVTLVIQLDEEEIARRGREGFLRPLTDRMALHAIGELPLGLPVPWASLDPLAAVVLDGLPPGVVESDAEVVVRRFRPAVQLVGAVICGREPESSLRSVSWLAPDAPRGIGVAQSVCGKRLVDRARTLGIGVVTDDGSHLQRVVEPSRRFLVPSGPPRWRNAELAYEAWLTLTRSQPIPRSPAAPGGRRP